MAALSKKDRESIIGKFAAPEPDEMESLEHEAKVAMAADILAAVQASDAGRLAMALKEFVLDCMEYGGKGSKDDY